MGDRKRWFKVWCSILTDPNFDALPHYCISTWVRLGALVAEHGSDGTLSLPETQFFKRTNLSEDEFKNAQICLQNVNVKMHRNGNDTIVVAFGKWNKYQVDSTSTERSQKRRNALKCNGLRREEKRREKEEKKKEEIKEEKTRHLDFVLLTEREHLNLVKRFGESGTKERIIRLNHYIGSKGTKYKSHYHTILSWEEKNKTEAPKAESWRTQ